MTSSRCIFYEPNVEGADAAHETPLNPLAPTSVIKTGKSSHQLVGTRLESLGFRTIVNAASNESIDIRYATIDTLALKHAHIEAHLKLSECRIEFQRTSQTPLRDYRSIYC